MSRVLIAPDSFKGSLPAVDVARTLAEGWRSARPGDECVLLPLADGGEGTLAALEIAIPGTRRMPVPDAETCGRPGSAYWLLLPDGTGVAELAVTNGLADLAAPAPLDADTVGFGQVIAAATGHGVERLLLAVGGSASSDGGCGALQALGARFLDREGLAVPRGARGLLALDSVDLTGLPTPPAELLVLSDVRNPLLGSAGAARVYGPQKGASEGQVAAIERGLQRLAALIPAVDPDTPGAGAAGGSGFGLMAWGAAIAPGAEKIGRLCGLAERVAECDSVVTGEGRYDEQSASGKLVSHVVATATRLGAPVLLVAGGVAGPVDRFAAHVDLSVLAGSVEDAIRDPRRWLREAGRLAAARVALS
jgi:glycerate kinase